MPSINVRLAANKSRPSRQTTNEIQVSLKDGADASQLDAAKKQVTEQGGKITTEFKLIKGFTAEFPEDKVHTLSSNDHINVENDGEVRTQ
ncbi:hypothetical protein KCU81_g9350, partial [Aureobasidium melanogenum]|uniref:Inhibitor I9 domain-containing protein n=1 Tax=Aureobasidium melanogenum (strain CBS 110374) TaxID=1043003 RepID=A0A074VC04_AURM1